MLEHQASICASSLAIFSRLKAFGRDAQWSFEINPPWQIQIADDENLRNEESLLIGGKVAVENSTFAFYSLSIIIAAPPSTQSSARHRAFVSCCERNFSNYRRRRVLRRFHFDIDTGPVRKPRPVSHLQHGGDATELVFDESGFHYCLDPWLEKPRFAFPPMDIVLLLDFVFRQFQTAGGDRLVWERDWLSLVRRSEELVQKKYYERTHEYFQGTRRTNRHAVLYQIMCDPLEDWT